MFPVIEDAVKRGEDKFAYDLIASKLISAEDLINHNFRTREEIDRILKKYGQKDEENTDK